MKKTIGILFILGSLLVNIPYALLISKFNYPDILRESAGTVLTKFAEGGSGLIFIWLAFALSGLPLLIAVILLHQYWKDRSPALMGLATSFGIVALVAQLIGLLRWVFVVPVIVQSYISSESSMATKEASVLVFQAVHQFGGVLIGEYIGQLFTVGWMITLSAVILRTGIFKAWMGWLGIISAGIYLLGQTELIHTVIPTFISIDIAGFVGSILWILWMILLGVLLLLKPKAVNQSA